MSLQQVHQKNKKNGAVFAILKLMLRQREILRFFYDSFPKMEYPSGVEREVISDRFSILWLSKRKKDEVNEKRDAEYILKKPDEWIDACLEDKYFELKNGLIKITPKGIDFIAWHWIWFLRDLLIKLGPLWRVIIYLIAGVVGYLIPKLIELITID